LPLCDSPFVIVNIARKCTRILTKFDYRYVYGLHSVQHSDDLNEIWIRNWVWRRNKPRKTPRCLHEGRTFSLAVALRLLCSDNCAEALPKCLRLWGKLLAHPLTAATSSLILRSSVSFLNRLTRQIDGPCIENLEPLQRAKFAPVAPATRRRFVASSWKGNLPFDTAPKTLTLLFNISKLTKRTKF
jgi:hypothetical protein